MIKHLSFFFAVILAFAATAAAQQSNQEKPANIETLRVASLINSLAEQTAKILVNHEIEEGCLDAYINTIKRISTYSDSRVRLHKADIETLTDAFYSFIKVGGESVTRAEVLEEFSHFSTLGEISAEIAKALNEGVQESGM